MEKDHAYSRPFRVGMVEDHVTTCRGLQALLEGEPDLAFAGSATTVAELLSTHAGLDLVILALHLSDGATPAQNVRRIREAGSGVLIYTSGERPRLIQQAVQAGVLGVVRKSESEETLLAAVRETAAGRTVRTAEWAAALDGDPEMADAGLSPRELEVLELYASGEKLQRVARRIDASPSTVREHVDRIRSKYERVGRSAPTKIDLYRRAVEDGVLPSPG